MNACFCIGPQGTDRLCPCKMRANRQRDAETMLKGIAIGRALGRSVCDRLDASERRNPEGAGA